MDESINVENKKQSHKKQFRNLGIIACEILAGAAAGVAVAFPVAYVIGALFSQEGCFGAFAALGPLLLVVPPAYGLGIAVGVYLVGNTGKQTGSFLATLGGGFLGELVMVLLYFCVGAAKDIMLGIEKIVLWPLVFLAAPIMATIGFNLTRRYKE